MAANGFLSVAEASDRLGVNGSRVRALLASGQLAGDKLGGRWLVSEESVYLRGRFPRERGRQLRSANAWSALLFASGQPSPLGDRRDRARVLDLLSARGVSGLAPRLRDRAEVRRLGGHPGVLPYLFETDAVCLAGASGAGVYDLGLVPAGEFDAYVAHDDVDALVAEFGLLPHESGGANIFLRVLPVGVDLVSEGVAPLAAVALDLVEQMEPRGARIGREILERLDVEQRWRGL